MKKVIGILASLTVAAAFMPVSAGGYGSAGCGLGSIVFGSKPGMIQVLAATTNATFYSQTFGITTGTSNCSPGAILGKAYVEQKVYAHNNFESLKLDMARGEGERLNNLASLMGCKSEAAPALGSLTQTNFESIYTEGADAEVVLNRVRTLAGSDASISGSCTLL